MRATHLWKEARFLYVPHAFGSAKSRVTFAVQHSDISTKTFAHKIMNNPANAASRVSGLRMEGLHTNFVHNLTDDMITLDVGGTTYRTSKWTVNSKPECVLARMINAQQQQQQPAKQTRQGMIIPQQNNNTFFIDRDGRHFSYILNYLRDGKKMVLPLSDESVLQHIAREADFYQLPGLSKLCRNPQAYTLAVDDVVRLRRDVVLASTAEMRDAFAGPPNWCEYILHKSNLRALRGTVKKVHSDCVLVQWDSPSDYWRCSEVRLELDFVEKVHPI